MKDKDTKLISEAYQSMNKPAIYTLHTGWHSEILGVFSSEEEIQKYIEELNEEERRDGTYDPDAEDDITILKWQLDTGRSEQIR